jgi:hypothetical protein
MHTQSYKLVLNNPCEADWNSMTPTSTGRHCDQCSKSVIDFSSYSKEAIIDYFVAHTGESICGRMHKKQIENIIIQIDGNLLHTNISFWKKFLIVFLVVFGQQLYGAEFAFAQVMQNDTLKLDTTLTTKVDTSNFSTIISDSTKLENTLDSNTSLGHVISITDTTIFVDSIITKSEEEQAIDLTKVSYKFPSDFKELKIEQILIGDMMIFGGFGLMPVENPLKHLLQPTTTIFPKEILQTPATEKLIKHIHYATNTPKRKRDNKDQNENNSTFILPTDTEEERRKKKSV